MELIFGAVGCMAFVFSIAVVIFQKKEHEQFKSYMESSFKNLEDFNNSSYQVLVANRLSFIRQMKSLEPGNDDYWHFKYRFEVCDHLGLLLMKVQAKLW